MRDYARVAPTWWTRAGRALRGQPDAQVLALYLQTGPNSTMYGLYYLPMPTIIHETGLTAQAVAAAFAVLAHHQLAYYDAQRELLYAPEMAHEQIGAALKASDKRVRGIEKVLATLGDHPYRKMFKARYATPYNLAVSGSHSEGGAGGLLEGGAGGLLGRGAGGLPGARIRIRIRIRNRSRSRSPLVPRACLPHRRWQSSSGRSGLTLRSLPRSTRETWRNRSRGAGWRAANPWNGSWRR